LGFDGLFEPFTGFLARLLAGVANGLIGQALAAALGLAHAIERVHSHQLANT